MNENYTIKAIALNTNGVIFEERQGFYNPIDKIAPYLKNFSKGQKVIATLDDDKKKVIFMKAANGNGLPTIDREVQDVLAPKENRYQDGAAFGMCCNLALTELHNQSTSLISEENWEKYKALIRKFYYTTTEVRKELI